MSLQYDLAWSQIQGGRDYQQDSAAIVSWETGYNLLILADGMGGHVGGDQASQCIISAVRDYFVNDASDGEDNRSAMLEATRLANAAVYDAIQKQPELEGMGSTLITAVLDEGQLQWLSIGDSPLWLLRGTQLRRLNANHSVAAELAEKVAKGEITAAEAATSPNRSQLLEAVMGDEIRLVDAPTKPMALQADDVLVLASDGVETLDTDTITRLLAAAPDAKAAVDAILAAILEVGRPRQDNATAIVVRVTEAATSPLKDPDSIPGGPPHKVDSDTPEPTSDATAEPNYNEHDAD